MAVDKWLDGDVEPRDIYDLAGLARFHPAAKEVLAALDRSRVELYQQKAHWRNEVRGKAERLLTLAEQGRQIFSQENTRAAYDERLFGQIAAAFQAAFTSANRQHEQVRRWLRMSQNVHAAKLEEVLRRLASADDKPIVATQPSPQPQASAKPSPAAAEDVAAPAVAAPRKPARNGARPPPRPEEATPPDHFGLLWIVGTAIATAIVFVGILFFFFGDRFVAKRQPAQAKGQSTSTPPEVGGNGEPESPKTTLEPAPSESPDTKPASAKPKGELEKSAPKDTEPKENTSSQENTKKSGPSETDPNAPPVPEPKRPEAPAGPATTNPPATTPATSTAPLPPARNASRQVIRQGQPVHALAWNGTGDQLAVAGDGDVVRIWDIAKNAESQVLKEAFPSCAALAFGKGKLAAATGQGTVYIWNAATWKLESSLRHVDMQDAKAVVWGSSGDVVVGDNEGNLRFISLSGGNQTGAIEYAKPAGGIQSLVACKNRWITGHLDGTVLIWSSAGKNVMHCLASNSGVPVLDALAGPSAGASKSALFTPGGKEVCYDLAVSPDEKLLAVAAQDVDLWELDSKNYLVRRRFVNGAKNDTGYRCAAFSPDSKFLAVGAGDGTLLVIDLVPWTAVYLEKFAGPIHRVAWRPGQTRQLAVGSEDGTATIITLGKESTAGVPSPLDPKAVLTEAQQNATDGDWGLLAQRISYLSIFRLPSTEKITLDRLRLEARKGAKELVNSVASKSPDDLETAASTLQEAIDLDPAGEGAKSARDALGKLNSLTVAAAKAPAPSQPASTGRRGGKALPTRPGMKRP